MVAEFFTTNTKYFLMLNIKEIIAASVFPAIKEVGKLEMKEVLAGVKNNNGSVVYENILHAVYSSFSILRKSAVKTRTVVDDGIIDLVLETVRECAETDNIDLT
jgi:hypothetical protein